MDEILGKILEAIHGMGIPGYPVPLVLEPEIRKEEQSNYTDPRRDDIPKAIAKFSELLKKNGYLPKSVLGKGSNGIAFELADGDVLKLTVDESEAKAMNYVKTVGSLKHVVRVKNVFRLPHPFHHIFGVVQEKLREMPEDEAQEFQDLVDALEAVRAGREMMSGDAEGIYELFRKNFKPEVAKLYISLFRFFQMDEIIKELSHARIEFWDYHPGNIMKRGAEFVMIDLGKSQSPGKAPDVIECSLVEDANLVVSRQHDAEKVLQASSDSLKKRGSTYVITDLGESRSPGAMPAMLESLTEKKSDIVSVIYGAFQPPGKVTTAKIRKIAAGSSKVIVVLDPTAQPFDYDVRVDMLRRSLPDVEKKIEIYRAEDASQSLTTDVPEIISGILQDHPHSSVKPDVAVMVYVTDDRFSDVERQVADSEMQAVTKRLGVPDSDPSLVQVIQRGDRKAFEKLVDAHLVSNADDLEDVWDRLSDSLGVRESLIREKLSDVGGEVGIKKVLDYHAFLLKSDQGITIGPKLGQGDMGVVYDIGRNEALKVTTDTEEALVVFSKLRKKQMRHIVRVKEVFKFPPTPGINSEIWGIRVEKLQPLSPDEIRDFESLKSWIRDDADIINFTATANVDQIRDRIMKITRRDAYREMAKKDPPPEGQQPATPIERRAEARARQMLEHVWEKMERFQIVDMIKELRQLGIQFADFHAQNVMKRGSDYVLTDLSKAKTFESLRRSPTLEDVTRVVEVSIAGDTFGTPHVGTKAGSSGWSSSRKMDVQTTGSDGWSQFVPLPKIR